MLAMPLSSQCVCADRVSNERRVSQRQASAVVPRINLHRLDATALKRYRQHYHLADVGPNPSRVRPCRVWLVALLRCCHYEHCNFCTARRVKWQRRPVLLGALVASGAEYIYCASAGSAGKRSWAALYAAVSGRGGDHRALHQRGSLARPGWAPAGVPRAGRRGCALALLQHARKHRTDLLISQR